MLKFLYRILGIDIESMNYIHKIEKNTFKEGIINKIEDCLYYK